MEISLWIWIAGLTAFVRALAFFLRANLKQSGALTGRGLPARHRRIAYIREAGDGPWGKCEWTPTVKPGQAYF